MQHRRAPSNPNQNIAVYKSSVHYIPHGHTVADGLTQKPENDTRRARDGHVTLARATASGLR